jgi:hypothetical protein
LAIAFGSFAVGIAVLIGVLLQSSFGSLEYRTGSTIIILAFGGLFLGAVVFLVGMRKKELDLFEIIFPLTALYMLNYPLRGMFIHLFPESTRFIYGFPADIDTFLSSSLMMFNVGFLFFIFGYFWRGGETISSLIPRIRGAVNLQGMRLKGVAIYAIGLAAFLGLAASGSVLRFQWVEGSRTTAAYSMLVLISSLRVVGLYFIWVQNVRSSGSKGMLPVVIFAIEIASGLAIGSKQHLFQIVLAVLFAYHYSNRRIALRLIILLGVFLLVLFPLVQTYRDVFHSSLGAMTDPGVSDILGLTGDLSSSFLKAIDPGNTLNAIMNRANQLDYLTIMIHRVPTYINHTSTIWPNILAAFIPHAIWQDKPTLALGRYMVSVIVGSPSHGNAPMTNVGELYLNFGIIGVPTGMFLLGVIYRILYSYLNVITNNRVINGAFYLSAMPSMLFLSTGIASFPAGLTRTFLLMLFLMWLLFRRPANSHSGRERV